MDPPTPQRRALAAQASGRSPGLLPLLGGINLLGAMALDAYLPAFSAIERALSATPIQMQQTLSAYFIGFGIANLVAGTLADAIGRRPVILAGVLLNALAFIACAGVQTTGQLVAMRFIQGVACSAAVSVTLAVMRDVYDPHEMQEAMTRLMALLVLGPILAPALGGWLLVTLGWRGLFGVMGLMALALVAATAYRLPETLATSARQALYLQDFVHSYRKAFSGWRFIMLSLAFSAGFNGVFLYVLAAPVYLGVHLGLDPAAYYLAFAAVAVVTGLLAATLRQVTRGQPMQRRVYWGLGVMLLAGVINLLANWAWPAQISWSLWPIAACAAGFVLAAPRIQVLALDVFPDHRGLSSALQATWVALTNAAVAGLLIPIAMHTPTHLAGASMLMISIGFCAWLLSQRPTTDRPA
ncbi:MAG: hypothetical protein RI884_2591 [Pseudomonadota bacterium]|jgi:DHA1 family bicyclomycin/chloramphenicol resistance-like MFS transporter